MSFEVAAEAYDRFMGMWSRELSPQLADLAGITRGMRVLDVGSGPGALTGELVARLGAPAVAAVDPSAPFVVAARERHPGVDVRQAAAEALPFPDGGFDAALAQLVIHFLPDPDAGLREMARVTRPGGVIAACVWDYAGGQGPLGPFWGAARAVAPGVDDEATLPGTRQGSLADLFTGAGLGDVEEAALAVSRAYAGFDGWWEPFTRGVGPAGSWLARQDAERAAQVRDRCRSMLPTGGFVLTARAWAARGVVQARSIRRRGPRRDATGTGG